MTDSFEIMKVPILLTLNVIVPEEVRGVDIITVTQIPADNELTEEGWNKATELAKEGWELVSAIPITAASYPAVKDRNAYHRPRDISHSYTAGYILFFKRRITPNP